MQTQNRNTGAIIHSGCVMKIHDSIKLSGQVDVMKNRPDVYCKILGEGQVDGKWFCVMPRYHSYLLADITVLESAFQKLASLWNTKECYRSIGRHIYNAAILEYDVPEELKEVVRRLYSYEEVGHHAYAIHGDATVENFVHDGEEAFWIDPSLREIPMEREVDLGKLYVSYLGYNQLPPFQREHILQFIQDEGNFALVKYYAATHLVRIWKDQVDSRGLILKIAKEL